MSVPDSYIRQLKNRMRRSNLSISDQVLSAFKNIPRHVFVPTDKNKAYQDTPLPIGSGQTISAPHMYAMMMSRELSDPKPGMDVLEIGTGSGYGSALLAYVVKPGSVITIERHKALVNQAKEKIEHLDLENVKIIHGDGTSMDLNKNFDRILVTAAGPKVPEPLIKQLKQDGKMIIPLESRGEQWLSVVTKNSNRDIEIDKKFRVRFVPLIGEQGYES